MHPKPQILVFLAVISLLGLGLAQAADFSNVDLQPWVRCRYTRYNVGIPPLGGLVENFVDGSLLVTKGGGVFAEHSDRLSPVGEPGSYDTFITRGIATPAERQAFNTAVAKAKLGSQQDCALTPETGRTWEYEFIWYGRGGRRNKLRVSDRSPANQTLPTCPQEVVDFLLEGDGLVARVGSHPDSEVLVQFGPPPPVPPHHP